MRPDQPPGLTAFIIRVGGSIDVVAVPSRRMEATLTPTQLRAVAACNEVSFIDEWGGPGGVDMDIARRLGTQCRSFPISPSPAKVSEATSSTPRSMSITRPFKAHHP
jgi:hypothetical protein